MSKPRRPPPRPLSRRTLLRGTLGGAAVSLAAPRLLAMLNGNGTAYAAGRPGARGLPRRVGVFFWGNGVRHKQWIPAVRGAGWHLSEELEPLQRVKRYLNVVTGTNIKTGNEQGHHAGTVGILSGCPMVSQPHPSSAYASTFSAPSIDQVAAAAFAGQTPFRSLELGVCRQVTENEGTTLLYLSHRGPDAPNPPEYDPGALFERLFGQGTLAAVEGLDRSVLDVVAGDARALAAQLGAEDRRRMDQHLESVRELERRITTRWPRPQPRCDAAALAGRFAALADPAAGSRAGQEARVERNLAMSRLSALALSCDLTRVFSFMFSGSVGETAYWEVGEDQSHHQLTHDEPAEQPLVHAGTVFIMRQLAALLEALHDTPDGAGNLLDTSVILASSDTADGRGHTLEDYPILVAGRGGGRLKHPGVHYRSDSGENASKVLLTVLRAAGLPLARFGQKGGEVDGGLGAIEA
jgi:hypothetical protein